MSRWKLRANQPITWGPARGLTLVEMLVAISITLVMMAALVTVFANISGSVTRRRATIEMSSSLRNVRDTLARDLAGATCPTVPWQRPESNVGYFELIEGPQNDYYPTPWLWDSDDTGLDPDPIGTRPGIDLTVSSLPGSNLRSNATLDDEEGRGRVLGSNEPLIEGIPTDGRGLGDADDILMLTVRNEDEPFIGRIPKRFANDRLTTVAPLSDPASRGFGLWGVEAGDYTGGDETVESQLAEVVWFAVENPTEVEPTFAFGEPGYRTIYRRALLILPDIDYGIVVRGQRARPGVVWVLPEQNAGGGPLERRDVATALGSLIAFQERYDLSVRLEWDPLLPNNATGAGIGRWVLVANSLSDLTKRENRFEHHGYAFSPPSLIKPADNPENALSGVSDRYYPFAAASSGRYPNALHNVEFRGDAFHGSPAAAARFQAVAQSGTVVSFQPLDDQNLQGNRQYRHRPFVRITRATDTPATARAILNEDGYVVHVTTGLAPLGGVRRGDDIMVTDALGFDVRVFDPGAPTYAYYPQNDRNSRADQLIRPGDPGWTVAFQTDVPSWLRSEYLPGNPPGNLPEGPNAASEFSAQRAGAYVDLGYGGSYFLAPANELITPGQRFVPLRPDRLGKIASREFTALRFFDDGLVRLPEDNLRLAPASTTAADLPMTFGYATFDTWSTHYESNGENEDRDVLVETRPNLTPRVVTTQMIDEGTNGLDDPDPTSRFDPRAAAITEPPVVATDDVRVYGPDDPDERETRPPYDTALRGVQVALRVYERDSRQIREVKVRESFVPE